MHPVPPAAACASTVALPRTNRPKPTAAPRRLCRPVSKRRWLTPVLLGLVLSSAALGSARAAPSVKPYTIVAFGDSTTAPSGTLVVYPNLLQNELIVRDRPVRVINAGIGGNTTSAALARLAAEVLAHRPDLVVVQFGINDSAVDVWKNPPAVEPRVPLEQFEANLRGIVQTLRARSAKVILMTPNPLRWTLRLRELYHRPPYDLTVKDGMNVRLRDYAETVRRIARTEKVGLVDIFNAFADWDTRAEGSIDALLLDGMHPNEQGHRLVADLLGEKIAAQDNRVSRKPPAPPPPLRR